MDSFEFLLKFEWEGSRMKFLREDSNMNGFNSELSSRNKNLLQVLMLVNTFSLSCFGLMNNSLFHENTELSQEPINTLAHDFHVVLKEREGKLNHFLIIVFIHCHNIIIDSLFSLLTWKICAMIYYKVTHISSYSFSRISILDSPPLGDMMFWYQNLIRSPNEGRLAFKDCTPNFYRSNSTNLNCKESYLYGLSLQKFKQKG